MSGFLSEENLEAFAGWLQYLLKTGGRPLQHVRSFILELAEDHLTPTLFRHILGRIERPALPLGGPWPKPASMCLAGGGAP